MASIGISFVELLWELFNSKPGKKGRVTFRPSKPAFENAPASTDPLPRCTPEEEGVDSDYIAAFMDALSAAENTKLHQITIARHGKIIFEKAIDPYVKGIWHTTYSMCKTFTGMAIGVLVDEGKLSLDDLVISFFPKDNNILQSIRFHNLTVRHLLTMCSASSFNEVGAVTTNDWVSQFFNAGLKGVPGTKFDYNSMNSFMLSAIVEKVSGKRLDLFLQEKVFTPLGIHKVYWETSPEGICKGGWGLFLRQEDAVKLGILYMQRGKWNGKQIISEAYVKEATTPQIPSGKPSHPYYGYHLWVGKERGIFTYNGMLGQNVYCFPDSDMIIATNAGNPELFFEGGISDIVYEYFAGDYHPSDMPLVAKNDTVALPVPKETRAVSLSIGNSIGKQGWKRNTGKTRFFKPDLPKEPVSPVPSENSDPFSFAEEYLNHTFELDVKSIGIAPLLFQVIHNNYSEGITSLSLHKEDHRLILEFRDGHSLYRLPVSLDHSTGTVLDLNGEPYLVGIKSKLMTDPEDRKVLYLRLCFLEEALERDIAICFHRKDCLILKWNETPGTALVLNALSNTLNEPGSFSLLMTGVLSQISPELLTNTVRGALTPETKARIVR